MCFNKRDRNNFRNCIGIFFFATLAVDIRHDIGINLLYECTLGKQK